MCVALSHWVFAKGQTHLYFEVGTPRRDVHERPGRSIQS
jgi:hypothetical protein